MSFQVDELSILFVYVEYIDSLIKASRLMPLSESS
jgi:hypothetical protein